MVDAVVIGTGAGGAPLTARLAEAGLSVVALEAGRSFKPNEHVADELAADIYWMEERLSGGNDPTAFGSNNSGMGSAARHSTGAPSAHAPIPATCN
ncbi:hypothetical protein GCM10020258_40190 [Sphingomonas yabuuchiae]